MVLLSRAGAGDHAEGGTGAEQALYRFQLHPRLHTQVQFPQYCCAGSALNAVLHGGQRLLEGNCRGAPYWEPSFATIAPSQEVAANCVSASVGPPEDSNASEHAHVHGLASGHANGHENGVVANGHAGADKDTDTRSTCSERPPATHWARAAGAWQALRGLLLCSRAPPAVPALFRTPAGVPALHGVAHQISEEQMERIKLTEGGGGNKDMGKRTPPSPLVLYRPSSVPYPPLTDHLACFPRVMRHAASPASDVLTVTQAYRRRSARLAMLAFE